MEYKDYYKILGVSKNANEKEIKRQYRKLARQYHPDKNPGDDKAEEKFKSINEAYEVIGDPENRAKYDQLGQNYHRFRQMGGNPGDFDFSQWFNQGGGQYQQADLNDLFGNGGGFSDFFTSIFGGSMGQRRAGGNPFGSQPSSMNRDIEESVEITLEEAYQGTTRSFSQNGQTFTAKIPAGAKTGTKIRLRGKGVGGSGDLFLVVKVRPHKLFTRSGAHLRVDVFVAVTTAVLGGKVSVPTLDGLVNLTIPAGTQGGQTFRLSGKGMPQLRKKDNFGDLLATIKIRVPKELSDKEKSLYEELKSLAENK